ncbi:hypothetical protein EDM76_06645 [bacterium]|nr:MAG: hypothetical protein EDM76_06645 [bacterium]
MRSHLVELQASLSRLVIALGVGALAALALGACGDDDTKPGSPTPPPSESSPEATRGSGGDDTKPGTLTLKATDFAFELEGAPKPGVVRVVMPNEGKYVHQAQFFRVDGDHTAAELIATIGPLIRAGKSLPGWVTWWGGPGALAPGETAEHYIDFDEGRYIVLCFQGDPDGVPHLQKGQLAEVTFEGNRSGASLPSAKVEITGKDDGQGKSYAFGLPPSIAAGDTMVSFRNEGTEPHEMQLVRLSGDLALEKVVDVFLKKAAPPAGFNSGLLGGPQVIRPGESTRMRIDFKPGQYVFICPVPGPGGVSHAGLGMAARVEVK